MNPVRRHLHKIFNRLAAPAASLALFFTLAAAPQAAAQETPSNTTTTVTAFNSIFATTTKDSAACAEMMTALKNQMARTAAGRDLLAMAQKYNVTIEYEDNLLLNEGCAGYYQPTRNRIAIDPVIPAEGQVCTLAHELWHARQNHVMGSQKMLNRYLTPEQLYAGFLFCEADAFAYAAWFMADRARTLDTALADDINPYLVKVVRDLYDEMGSADGLTEAEYRNKALEVCFANMNFYHLDSYMKVMQRYDHITEILALTNHTPQEFNQKFFEKLREKSDDTPTDTQFEKFLRLFGGTKVAFNRRTALQDKTVSYETLLHDYPYRIILDDATDSRMMHDLVATSMEQFNTFKARIKASAQPAPPQPLEKMPGIPARVFFLQPEK